MQKSDYFTTNSIRNKAKEMLGSVSSLRARHEHLSIQEGMAALLVLDLQRYFFDPGSHAFIPSAEAILPNIQALMAFFTAKQMPIVFTRHINDPANAKTMAVWWKHLLVAGSQESELIEGIDPASGELIFKSQYDAFLGSRLESFLTEMKITQVVITGVMTHLCCETTARSAFGRGYEVFFVIDGTATYNEEFHQASVLNLAHGFAVPMLTEEILA